MLTVIQQLQNMRIYNNFPWIMACFDFIFTDILLMRHVTNAAFSAPFHTASVVKILTMILLTWRNKYVNFLKLLCKNIFFFFPSSLLPFLPPSIFSFLPSFLPIDSMKAKEGIKKAK